MKRFPQRVVCLTEETTEILYRIGAADLVVGVSGYTVRPPEARKKPRVSAFITADVPKIEALKPDLVLAFSDLQADIVRELLKRGHTVVGFNQRSIEEILQVVRMVGALVGFPSEAETLADELEANCHRVRELAAKLPRRPKVFFEEWDDPLISGIKWVSELVEIAGGDDVFPEMRERHDGPGRIVTQAAVLARAPEVILASWCGKKVRPERIASRPGWSEMPAVAQNRIHEVKSPRILQPGPAALTDGLADCHAFIAAAARGEPAPRLATRAARA